MRERGREGVACLDGQRQGGEGGVKGEMYLCLC